MNIKKPVSLSLEMESENLRQLAHQYQSSFEQSRDAISIFSPDYKILDINESMCRLSGYEKTELLSTHLSDLFPEILTDKGRQHLNSFKKEKRPPLFEAVLITRQNKKIHVEIAITILDGWQGNPLVYQGNIRDISQTRRILNKLKKNEEKYRSLIENLDVGIARSTPGPHGRYIEVNQAMVDLLGYSKAELFNANIFGFHENRAKADILFDDIMTKGSVREKEVCLLHKDGSCIIVSYTGKAIKDIQGRILYIDDILVDVTARKKIEEEIQKNEKLKSIGALAGGIAHHFNNIMTGLFGNISLAKLEIPPESQAVEYLNNAEECMKEGTSLTKQLLTFAKGGDPIKENLDIAHFIKDAAMFCLSGSNILLKFSADKDLWEVRADKSQISQVISNIIMNSRQAMPDGGQVDICIEKSDFLKDNLLTISKGRYIKILISDNGTGIHQRDMERIFDPYFSTRKDGSGMGLSICYSIIKKHDGHIFVSSQVGTGTTITIYLPALSTHIKKGASVMTTQMQVPSNGQYRILVMDDEDHIRRLLKKMLEKFGYQVYLTLDGEDAIQSYKDLYKQNSPPHLVIMDLTIPGGMGGKEAAQKILEFDPEAKIIVSSGYSTDPIMANYKDFGLKGIIPKPYRMADLDTSIKEILSENRT